MSSTLLGVYMRYLDAHEKEIEFSILKHICDDNGGNLPEQFLEDYLLNNWSDLSDDLRYNIAIRQAIIQLKAYILLTRYRDFAIMPRT